VLVTDLDPVTKRWHRVECTLVALGTLRRECHAVLRVDGGR
jgi:hypothetical protein